MSNLKEGLELVAIYFAEDDGAIRVGNYGITRLAVVNECGQMAGVPWVEVHKGDVMVAQYNCALLSGVQFVDK